MSKMKMKMRWRWMNLFHPSEVHWGSEKESSELGSVNFRDVLVSFPRALRTLYMLYCIVRICSKTQEKAETDHGEASKRLGLIMLEPLQGRERDTCETVCLGFNVERVMARLLQGLRGFR